MPNRDDGTGHGVARIFRSSPFVASYFRDLVRNSGRDLAAGFVLAAIAIPGQMATARLGGFSPEIGFFAFIAGSVAVAIFAANRFLAAGADSTITPIFSSGLLGWAAIGTPGYADLAAVLALMVGVILIVGGWARVGWIADLLSVPVTDGFLAGIAIQIIVLQLPGVLGIAAPAGSLTHRAIEIAASLDRTNLYCLAIGAGVILFAFAAKKVNPRIPGAFIGLVLAGVLVLALDLERSGVAVLGAVPSTLPALRLPAVTVDDMVHIAPLALIVALVTMVQTSVTTRSFASNPGALPAVNRDVAAVGAGSILAGLFGAFPVNVSPPLTEIVAETGGRSPVVGLTAAVLVLALLIFGSGLLADVPQAALAGVLLFIALRLFRVSAMIDVFRRTRLEFALTLITMIAIAVLPVETGVAIGVVLSLMHGMWITTRAHTVEFECIPGTTIWWAPNPKKKGERMPGIVVMAFQAPLSFLNAYDFGREMDEAIDRRSEPLKLVVLEASSIVAIDYTAARILADIIRHCRDRGIAFSVARLESVRAQEAFERLGLTELLGADHLFHSVFEAVQAATRRS
jgi:sulfate permease, SulP family